MWLSFRSIWLELRVLFRIRFRIRNYAGDCICICVLIRTRIRIYICFEYYSNFTAVKISSQLKCLLQFWV